MTRAELNETIKKAAAAHGFETSKENGVFGLIDIKSEEMNFTYGTSTDTEGTDWSKRVVETAITVTASVRKMGGRPTPEELLKTADEIRRGAELAAELQNMHLTFTERF